ncbi:MAG: TonB-dependent receptor, partial [Xanthomonadales bacterium]|nr:TonB-dependent receptor [Xanthomonadales bacterium]
MLAAGSPETVLGQDEAATEADDNRLEEVTVTARRRDESLLDVPIAMTAFGGEELERIGAQDIISVGQASPNVTLEVSRGTNTTLTAFIRGVGQQDPVAGFESGVGLYIDDVYLNRPQAGVLDIYDVERIEVLRGPQGTLYGRNTIGGAIKYVTRGLSDEPESKLRVSYGSYNQRDIVFTTSAPISDNFRIGGTIASLNRDGFGDNLNLGIDNYDKDFLGGRLAMEWDVSDDFSLKFTGDIIRDDSNPKQGHRLTVGALSGAPILNDVFDTRAGLNSPMQEVEGYGLNLTANWQLTDELTLRNILSYREDDTVTPIDFDSLPVADLDVPAIYSNEQLSNELQLVFESGRYGGVAGLYWLDASAFNTFDVILAQLGAALDLPGLNANTLGDVDTESWAAFADFSFDINDTVSVSVGGRYTVDERTSRVLRTTFIGGASPALGGTGVPIVVTSDFMGSREFTEFTPRASVSWQPNDDQNLYLTYSEGFKGGSFDPRGYSTAAPDLNLDGEVTYDEIFDFMAFEPEFVDSYEIGLNSNWMNGRVSTRIAVFRADYTDVQIPGSFGYDSDGDGTNDTFIGLTSNAADADINGIEFEGTALLGDSMNLSWAVGYLDANYNQFIDASGNDVADQRVFQNTPDLTGNISLTHEQPVQWFGNSGTFYVIGSASYRDDATQFEFPAPELDQKAFTLWDLSLVWEDDGGRWRAGLHAKNLTDEEYKVAGYYYPAPSLGFEGSVTAFYGNPRTITGTVEYGFYYHLGWGVGPDARRPSP